MDPSWLTGMITYSDAAIECRDRRFALPLFDRLVPWADQWSTPAGPTVEGPVSRPSADSPASSADTPKPTPTSQHPRHRANAPMRSSSPLGPTFYGEGCWPSAKLPATPRRPGSFLSRRMKRQLSMGTGTSNGEQLRPSKTRAESRTSPSSSITCCGHAKFAAHPLRRGPV